MTMTALGKRVLIPIIAVLLVLAPVVPATAQAPETGPGGDREPGRPSAAAAVTPAVPVARLEQALLDNMRAGGARDFDQRLQRLLPLLGEVLGIERMGRYLFGGAWGDLDPGRRQAFIEAFRRLSAATYAARFDAFNGESFEPQEVRIRGDSRALVRRTLVTADGERIAFDYLLARDDDGDWQIVNIITNGVSDLALKRSQYKALFASGGIEAVIDHVEEAARKQRND